MPNYYDMIMNDLNETNINIDKMNKMDDSLNVTNVVEIMSIIGFISLSKYLDYNEFEHLKYDNTSNFNELKINIILRLNRIRNEITHKLTFAKKYKHLCNFLHIIDLI
jgi:hypothetical protein